MALLSLNKSSLFLNSEAAVRQVLHHKQQKQSGLLLEQELFLRVHWQLPEAQSCISPAYGCWKHIPLRC